MRARAESVYVWPPDRPDWEFKYLSTALISAVWQLWCDFCRSIVLRSCAGSETKSGVRIPPRTGDNSWQRVAYEAGQAARGRPIQPASTIRFRRHEPTWGDQNLLLRVIPVLSPANGNTLLTGFGLSLSAPRHIQKVRNACAHLDSESIADVRRLTVHYTGAGLSHPADLLWWIEPASRTDAIFVWLDELKIIADVVTS